MEDILYICLASFVLNKAVLASGIFTYSLDIELIFPSSYNVYGFVFFIYDIARIK